MWPSIPVFAGKGKVSGIDQYTATRNQRDWQVTRDRKWCYLFIPDHKPTQRR
jgi:hypothetical protein